MFFWCGISVPLVRALKKIISCRKISIVKDNYGIIFFRALTSGTEIPHQKKRRLLSENVGVIFQNGTEVSNCEWRLSKIADKKRKFRPFLVICRNWEVDFWILRPKLPPYRWKKFLANLGFKFCYGCSGCSFYSWSTIYFQSLSYHILTYG